MIPIIGTTYFLNRQLEKENPGRTVVQKYVQHIGSAIFSGYIVTAVSHPLARFQALPPQTLQAKFIYLIEKEGVAYLGRGLSGAIDRAYPKSLAVGVSFCALQYIRDKLR